MRFKIYKNFIFLLFFFCFRKRYYVNKAFIPIGYSFDRGWLEILLNKRFSLTSQVFKVLYSLDSCNFEISSRVLQFFSPSHSRIMHIFTAFS